MIQNCQMTYLSKIGQLKVQLSLELFGIEKTQFEEPTGSENVKNGGQSQFIWMFPTTFKYGSVPPNCVPVHLYLAVVNVILNLFILYKH